MRSSGCGATSRNQWFHATNAAHMVVRELLPALKCSKLKYFGQIIRGPKYNVLQTPAGQG